MSIQIQTPTPIILRATSVATTYTVKASDQYIKADATSGAFTITVPAASVALAGLTVIIKKLDDNFTAITLGTGLSTTLNSLGETVEIFCNGATWEIIRRTVPGNKKAFTPTGAQTQNATYTGSMTRVQNCLLVNVNVAFSGATSGTFDMDPPTGITFDTTSLTSIRLAVGEMTLYRAGTYYGATVFLRGSNGKLEAARTSGTGLVGNAEPAAPAAADYNTFSALIPVTGWNS